MTTILANESALPLMQNESTNRSDNIDSSPPMFIRNTNNIPTKLAKKRTPLKCKYCNELGHDTRSCHEPIMIDTLNQLIYKITNYISLDAIEAWIRPMKTTMIRMLLCKYAYCTYSKITSQKKRIITFIMKIIKQKYEIDELNTRRSLSEYVEQSRFMEWYDPVETNLEELYIEYCTRSTSHFIRNEYEALHQMIETKHVPETFIPIPVLLLYVSFLRFQFHAYTMMRDKKRQMNTPVIIYDIKQVIAFEIETMDCPICMDSISTPEILVTECKHSFCNSCMQTIIYKSDTNRCNCPLCRTPIKKMTRYILT